jgi:hypothetical protein
VLYVPQALDSLFVSSYDSQGYRISILTLFNTGHDWWSKSKSQLRCGRRSVGWSVLELGTHVGFTTGFLLLSDSCGFVGVERSLWRDDESVVYNCYWPSPAQSFSGPSLEGLVTIFYCLRFETPQIWRARSPELYPAGTGWPSYTPRLGRAIA